MSIDPVMLALCKKNKAFEVVELSKHGLDFASILMSGETVVAHDCTELLNEIANIIARGKLPALHCSASGFIAFISGMTENVNQVTGSLLGNMSDMYVKADIVILENSIAMFSEFLEV